MLQTILILYGKYGIINKYKKPKKLLASGIISRGGGYNV